MALTWRKADPGRAYARNIRPKRERGWRRWNPFPFFTRIR
jgi:hypothetical protein